MGNYIENVLESLDLWYNQHLLYNAFILSRKNMNELQSLSEIFQNRPFRIPDYQRGYAWQDSQLKDFWRCLHRLEFWSRQ